MFKNYLKLAFRNFKQRKGHTFINILGLAIAITACIILGLYLQLELSYDTFHKKSDRIYRVVQTSITPERTKTSALTPPPLAPALESEYPRMIASTLRLTNLLAEQFTFVITSDTAANKVAKAFLESNMYFVDSTFFEVFDYKLIKGNPETALDKPLSLIITPETARKFFGDEKAMGKTIKWETGRMTMTVTGIMEPFPSNSHINADALASINSLGVYFKNPEEFYNTWFVTKIYTYILLKDGVKAKELTRHFPGFIQKYYASDRAINETFKLKLQPIERIHLYSNINDEMQPNSSILYVYLFATVALLLLIIACINFMNLATARAAERSQEVGMRKALGANRLQLFLQFMGESFLLTLIAFVVAIGFVMLAMPVFNNLIGLHLVFNPFQNILLLAGMAGLFLVIGLLAGAYPAVYLSGFPPREIMQEHTGKGESRSTLRKGLVVIQFTMSVILIIGTVIVFLQLHFMQHKKLGFEEENIVIMPIKGNLIAWEYVSFKKRAEQHSAIRSVTGLSKILGSDYEQWWRIAPADKAGVRGETNQGLWVTYDFVETFELEVIAGRSFSKEFSTDGEKGILINREMAEKLGHENPRDALGELFYYTAGTGEKKPLRVVGVVENFHYTSIETEEIKPLAIVLAANQHFRLGTINYAAAKITAGRTQQGLTHLKKVWSNIDFITPFNYTFQDEELAKIYASEATTSTVMGFFTILCIIVACLGLFGLASFTTSKRTKEIGIRKTLGASVGNIVILLNKQYIKLVLIANIIAWPVIYLLAGWWLQDFAYRMELGWNILLIFLMVAIASTLICIGTVSWQSIRAALTNPVNSLRSE